MRQAMDGRVGVSFGTVAWRRASQRQAGTRRDCLSTGTCEFAPARLAQDAMEVEPTGRWRDRHAGAHGFGYVPRKESDPRRGTARKRHGCRAAMYRKVTGSRLSPG